MSIYDKTKFICKTFIESVNTLFNMGKQLEEKVDDISDKTVPEHGVEDVGKVLTVTDENTIAWEEGGGSFEQVQANWTETNVTKASYIQNKPNIPAPQVNSDWNAESGVAMILNKPTIPEAPVQSDWNESNTGDLAYIKNKPTIPAAQVQSDWNQSDNTQVDYIKNKPSIPASPVQSNWNESDSASLAYIQNKPSIPEGLPSSTVGDQGKVLTVDDTGDAGWDYVPKELPTLGTAGQVLAVNSGATGIEWQTPSGGTQYSAGTGISISGENVISNSQPNVNADWNESNSNAPSYIQNKPSIPAAQVQSDWNQSDNTQVDYIKNKPSIPASPVQSNWNENDTASLAYIQNKPSIPAAQVQSDWSQSDNTQVDYIKNKPSIPTNVAKMYTGAGAPTTSTVGEVSDFYFDTTNLVLYECTAKTGAGEPIVYTYTWTKVDKELPSVSGNAGKVLAVNSGGTGVEWASIVDNTGYAYDGSGFINTGSVGIYAGGSWSFTANLGSSDYDWLIIVDNTNPNEEISVSNYSGTNTNQATFYVYNGSASIISSYTNVLWYRKYKRPKVEATNIVTVIGTRGKYCRFITYSAGNQGQVLTKNSNDEHDWVWADVPKELPATLGTAGQVLTVNSGATGVEWANVPTELPSTSGITDGYVLTNNNGTPTWMAGGGGGLTRTIQKITNTTQLRAIRGTAVIGDQLVFLYIDTIYGGNMVCTEVNSTRALFTGTCVNDGKMVVYLSIKDSGIAYCEYRTYGDPNANIPDKNYTDITGLYDVYFIHYS